MSLKEKFEERNVRLTKLYQICEDNEITYEDLAALLCAGMINYQAKDLKTNVMVQGRIFTVKIESN